MDVERELQQKTELLRESLQLLQSLAGGAGSVNHTPSPARDQVYIYSSPFPPLPSHPSLFLSRWCVCSQGRWKVLRVQGGCLTPPTMSLLSQNAGRGCSMGAGQWAWF